jgi:hypothetical protein
MSITLSTVSTNDINRMRHMRRGRHTSSTLGTRWHAVRSTAVLTITLDAPNTRLLALTSLTSPVPRQRKKRGGGGRMQERGKRAADYAREGMGRDMGKPADADKNSMISN